LINELINTGSISAEVQEYIQHVGELLTRFI